MEDNEFPLTTQLQNETAEEKKKQEHAEIERKQQEAEQERTEQEAFDLALARLQEAIDSASQHLINTKDTTHLKIVNVYDSNGVKAGIARSYVGDYELDFTFKEDTIVVYVLDAKLGVALVPERKALAVNLSESTLNHFASIDAVRGWVLYGPSITLQYMIDTERIYSGEKVERVEPLIRKLEEISNPPAQESDS